MPPAGTWIKMSIVGLGIAVGGPALVFYVTPSEEEIFKRYNPELQRRSLEGRIQRQEEFDTFVKHLKEYSKSDENIWQAAKGAEAKRRELAVEAEKAERRSIAEEMKKQRMDIAQSISDPAQHVAETPPSETQKRKWFWAW
ncbi:hypothetical protein, variant [Verruconis gallopava]|uniref:Cytochrome b mRNA-processing protein 4 n=1 Tax=Verruconis gallopava TaxID=253628 RepID=A0A0D2A035_9PEZI|nr:hypothetical protein, variant [Verruconis gallopava]KIV99669.1 hypothetical protein, variant [Verruconis gallopava]